MARGGHRRFDGRTYVAGGKCARRQKRKGSGQKFQVSDDVYHQGRQTSLEEEEEEEEYLFGGRKLHLKKFGMKKNIEFSNQRKQVIRNCVGPGDMRSVHRHARPIR